MIGVKTGGAGREDPDADFSKSKGFIQKEAQGKNRGRGRAGYQNT